MGTTTITTTAMNGGESDATSQRMAEFLVEQSSAGTLPDEYYDGTLNWWRSGGRRLLGRSLKYESRWIGAIQRNLRTPFLDSYFVYTSTLGTHTFFLTFLPLLFFFGYIEVGLGLVFVLASGVYATSFLKDLFCSPRPFMSSVTRLSVGNHHLEYGFPSTHSANCVSAAVYLYLLLASSPMSSNPSIFYPSCILLVIYAVSVIFGRIYCGMHSFVDCTTGMILGYVITMIWWKFGSTLLEVAASSGWKGPVLVVIGWILVINQHPQPVDDCPCFEDTVAFVSVLAGMALSIWHSRTLGVDQASGFFKLQMPGSSLETPMDIFTYSSFAILKMVLGIATVFAFRLIVKPTLQAVLPPTFRFLATLFTLPHRRWYKPATEYEHVPAGHVLGRGGRTGMGVSVPSVIDLPGSLMTDETTDMDHINGDISFYRRGAVEGLKRRKAEGGEEKAVVDSDGEESEFGDALEEEAEVAKVRHYDADVVTRATVYSGIGILVAEIVPVCFELVGWGL